MKLLVFAHTPPPHHGQSFMVQVMLDGLRSNRAGGFSDSTSSIGCFHVNARYSRNLADVGGFRFEKPWLVFRYAAQALRYRFQQKVTTLYYVPAPARQIPLFRDWMALLICRPFFRHVILHWHAVGLGEWLTNEAGPITRWITRRILSRVDLSIVLSKFNEADALTLNPQRLIVVSNGIPDPCPDFRTNLLDQRRLRLAARQGSGPAPVRVKVLFLAHSTREKGLFDALESVALANQHLRSNNSPWLFDLTVAGNFLSDAERAEFEARAKALADQVSCELAGFVAGEAKNQLLAEADIFLFPTFYANEGQPVSLIEAMAFGLPVVTTRWRSIPEFLPADYAGSVTTHDVPALARALVTVAMTEDGEKFRVIYEREFTVEKHLQKLKAALLSVEP